MRLRWRWALTSALVSGLAVASTVAVAVVVARDQLIQRVDESLLARTAPLADPPGIEGQPAPPLPRPLHRLGGAVLRRDAIVQVIDVGGEVVFSFPGDPALPVAETDLALARSPGERTLRTVQVDGERHRMLTAHLDGPEGALQVAMSLEPIEASLSRLARDLAVVAAVIAAAAGLVGYGLARRGVRPIERLTARAEQIARTEDLATPLDTDDPAEAGRLAAAFASILATLRRSREQQRRLVSDAGHELRTPLTALRSNLETLRRRGDRLSEEQRSELLDAALSESEELTELALELVDLSSDFRAAEEVVDVDLADLAEAVAERYRRRSDREIVVVAVEDGLEVRGRRSQLERAVGNLVDNAWKWGRPGTPVEVVVSSRELSVRDHGPGIAEEDLPFVFERFYRSTADRSRPGSGLGLAIVEHVVTAHGGEVFASNHPEGGAVVGFRFPPDSP